MVSRAASHTNNLPEGVARLHSLPSGETNTIWNSIKLPAGVRERLLAQALSALRLRQNFTFETAPLHGLILLAGPPGTGKTTLARGLAYQIAKQLPEADCRFVEVDPHALASSALGRSQQAMTKLFEQTIPELAIEGVTIVLLDELETLASSRYRLSLEANPVDVHRATDAALAGIDRLAREHRHVLLIGTTNFPESLDPAMLSRADHVEQIGMPDEEARREIILDTLRALAKVWRKIGAIEAEAGQLAVAADGLDGRRIRKQILAAIGSDLETARDPNKLTRKHVESAFRMALETQKGPRLG